MYIALSLVCIFTTGCGGIRDSKPVKSVKSFYNTYLNKPVVFEYKDIDSLKGIEREFAVRFARLDSELTSLERAMDSVLDPSRQEALINLLNQFPWVSNTFVVDPNEYILGAIPESAPAIIDFTYLEEKEVTSRELYATVLESEAGSLLLTARPYVHSEILMGYLGVSFDPRNLLPFVGDPSQVFILTPDVVLWSGNYILSSTPLEGIDWNSKIDHHSYGTVTSGDFKAFWLVRYFAGLPLIFGVIEEKNIAE